RHELLNTLQIVGGRVDLAGNALADGDVEGARESLRATSDMTDRMTDIVDDLSVLARHGKTLGDTERLDFETAAREAFDHAETGELTLSVSFAGEGDGSVVADPVRLRELFASAFEFAAHNGASEVVVERGDDWFAVAGDGESHDASDPEQFFEYGSAVPDTEAGITLPNVDMLASVHGWSASVDPDYEDGVRIVVSDTDAVRVPDAELD
ncbi:MAG: sensor histidine kinase, partial [Halobacterium sp.]